MEASQTLRYMTKRNKREALECRVMASELFIAQLALDDVSLYLRPALQRLKNEILKYNTHTIRSNTPIKGSWSFDIDGESYQYIDLNRKFPDYGKIELLREPADGPTKEVIIEFFIDTSVDDSLFEMSEEVALNPDNWHSFTVYTTIITEDGRAVEEQWGR